MPEKKDKAYPSQFDKVKEITDKLEAGIQALFESEAFKKFELLKEKKISELKRDFPRVCINNLSE